MPGQRLSVASVTGRVQGIEDQRTLAAPRNPGDEAKQSQRERDINVFQVVSIDAADERTASFSAALAATGALGAKAHKDDRTLKRH